MKRALLSVLVLAILVSVAVGEEGIFVSKPSANPEGKGARIKFSVSAPTDVEVAILDAEGKVVRHLAAGLLGEDAPLPLKKGTLEQELLWDGKDDLGEAAAGGAFKVRVSIGSKPSLENILGWDGNTLGGSIVGLAVDGKGQVYVLESHASGGEPGRSNLRVFSRAGKYLRTIMPYPANLPEERTASIGHLDVEGERLPIVYSAHGGNLHPLTSGMTKQKMTLSPRGYLVMASALGTYIEHGPPRHLLALAPDGGAPEGMSFVGPRIREPKNFLGGAGERGAPWFDHLAASPDGQWIYLTQAGNSYAFNLRHCVFRLRWTDKELGEPFLGNVEPGDDDQHFNHPQGVATDEKGDIYVCDRGNNRVMVFSPEGKLLGKFPVDAPEQIGIHPASSQIYVVSRRKEPKQRPAPDTVLRKFSSWDNGSPRELAALAMKTIEVIALDPAASPIKLWMGLYTGWGKPNELRPVIDKGDRFEVGEPINNLNGLIAPRNLAADPARNRVLVRESDVVFLQRRMAQVNLGSGKKAPMPIKRPPGPAFALDREGNIYVAADYNMDGIYRYDPDGKPLPFPAIGDHHIKRGLRNPHWSRGIAVTPDGTIYLLRVPQRHRASQVDVYGPDGKLEKEDLIKGLGRGACGIGIDAAGNIYTAVNIKKKEQPYPRAFMGKVPARPWWFWYGKTRPEELWGERGAPWCYTYYNPYLWHWGSIVKFSSAGGAIYGLRRLPRDQKERESAGPFHFVKNAPPGAARYHTAYLEQEVRVVGALWSYHGYGIVPSSISGGDPSCCCNMSSFAVDLYGRVYFPNPFRFSVEMLDTNGNRITRIGSYGNADSAGPGSKVPQPEIAFAWPTFVSYADGKLYVSDSVNQRVMVVKLAYRSEQFCSIR